MSKIEFIPFHGCWVWVGAVKDRRGYGSFRMGGRCIRAHRASWMIHFGDPGELGVLHRCDNPPCCNPDHLFLGDQSANMLDASTKGRHGMGSKTHCKRGHPLSVGNLAAPRGPHLPRARVCLTCARDRMRGYRVVSNTPERRAKRNAYDRERRKALRATHSKT